MTTAFVQNVGSATSGTTGSGTYPITVSAAATSPGNGVILWARFGGGDYVTAVSDTRGNTWQVDSTGSQAQANASICSCVIAPGKALVSGDTITLTLRQVQGDAAGAAACAEFSGLLVTAGHLDADKTATAQTGSGTTITAATATNTSEASELVLSAVAFGGTAPTLTPGGSDPDSGGTWNDLALPAAPAVSDAAYQIAEAVSEFSCTWTSTGSGNINAAIVTYKTAGAPADAIMGIFP
jgi:hypothetical protein